MFGNYVALIAASSTFLSIAIFISSLTENLLVSIIANWGAFIALIYLDDLASLTGSAAIIPASPPSMPPADKRTST